MHKICQSWRKPKGRIKFQCTSTILRERGQTSGPAPTRLIFLHDKKKTFIQQQPSNVNSSLLPSKKISRRYRPKMATQTPIDTASPPTSANIPAVAKLENPSRGIHWGSYIEIDNLKYEARRPVLASSEPSPPSSVVDLSSPSSPPSPPSPSLGKLGVFPDELLTIIVKNLSINSLIAFESTNQAARDFVQSVCPALAHVNKQVPQILAAAVALNLPYSIDVLDKMLEKNVCYWCQTRGGSYLSLLEQRIYCVWCLEYDEWLPDETDYDMLQSELLALTF